MLIAVAVVSGGLSLWSQEFPKDAVAIFCHRHVERGAGLLSGEPGREGSGGSEADGRPQRAGTAG